MSDRALDGVSVLVPRARSQADALSDRIRALGGEPVEAPTIAIGPGDAEGLATHLRALAGGRFVAVCFTSPNGVQAVAGALERSSLSPGILDDVLVAAVGPGTARTVHGTLGVGVDLIPATSTTTALAAAFPAGSGRVLLPRADIASAELPDGLRRKGYEPVQVSAYTTVRPERLPDVVLRRLADGDIDLLAFTSSSTVRNFVELVGDRAWTGRVVSIGPVTSRTAREAGFAVHTEARRHDLDGLVAALVEAAGGRTIGPRPEGGAP